MSLEGYLADEERSREDFDAEVRASAEEAVKASLVLDAVARKEELGVDEAELTEQVVRRAQRAGVDPQTYADRLVQAGQLPALAGDVLRGKAMNLLVEAAVITDSSGAPVDLQALAGPPAPGEAAAAATEGETVESADAGAEAAAEPEA